MNDRPNGGVHATAIVRDKRGMFLCIHKRDTSKQHPWRFVGGKPEQGETLIAACARELREETGIEALSLVFYTTFDQVIDGARWRGYYFLCDSFKGNPVIMEPDKHDSLGWFKLSVPECGIDVPEPEKEIAKRLLV